MKTKVLIIIFGILVAISNFAVSKKAYTIFRETIYQTIQSKEITIEQAKNQCRALTAANLFFCAGVLSIIITAYYAWNITSDNEGEPNERAG